MSTLSPKVNSATTNDLLQLVHQLQKQLLTTTSSSNVHSDNDHSKPKRTFVRTHTDKYCWSHEERGHEGKACRKMKPGHRDEATFGNKLGGSTFYCKKADDPKERRM